MRNLILTALTLLFAASSFAQNFNTPSQNSVSLELLGRGVFYSLNYEHKLTNNGNHLEGVRVKAGAGMRDVHGDLITSVPVSISNLFNLSDRDYVELGVGGTALFGMKEDTEITALGITTPYSAHGVVGYRFVPDVNRGLYVKTNFTPIYAGRFIMYGGLGGGYIF